MIVLFALVLAALSASGKVIFTKPGQTVTLECGVSDSKNLRWSLNGVLVISVSGSYGYQSKGNTHMKSRCSLKQADLVVRGVVEADAGTFTCQAGVHSQEMTLVVFSVGVTPSHDLQAGSQAKLSCEAKPGEVGVQWQGPDEKIHPASKEVSLDLVGRQDAGTWKCTLSLNSDTHTESLEVTVKEPRPMTPSPPSMIPGNVDVSPGGAAVDPRSPHATAPLGIPWWMWAVIGGGGLVVVLLAILVACMCRRVRRKRRLARKMKNGLQLRTPPQYCQCDRPTAAAKPQQRRQRAKPSAPPQQTLLVE